jgi:hypothetical protein
MAIAHKRQLLFEHFAQQRRAEALAAAHAQEAAAAAARQLQEAAAAAGSQVVRIELARASSFGQGGGDASAGEASPVSQPGAATAAAAAAAAGEGPADGGCGPALQPSQSLQQQQQQQQQGSADGAGQQVQLSAFAENPELREWREREEAAHQLRLQQQQQQQREAAGPGARDVGWSGSGAQAGPSTAPGLQGAATEALLELANLSERLSEGLASLRFAPALCSPSPAGLLAGLLGPGPAGGGEGEAAAAAAAAAAAWPVMVEAEREAFSQLLLHRNAIQDHIPDRWAGWVGGKG